MCKVWGVVTRKGGVGKTTTSTIMAYLLAKAGYKVALIDFDGQRHSTKLSGVMLPEKLPITIYEILSSLVMGEKLPERDRAIKKKEKLILGSILAGLGTLFNLFFSAAMHKMLSREAVTFTLVPLWECISGLFTEQRQGIADIGKRKQALFFILPDEKTTYYPIASLMVSQLYELLVHQSDERGGRLLNRVNFVLEEFGNFTKINDLTNKLTVAGGRGMRFHFFLQSFEQLTEKYSKETAAIVKSNCQSWVYLQADDKETLSEICEKLGKYTCSAYQLSSQHGKYVNPSSSSSISLVARDLLTTDEIRRVSRPYQIVVSRSHPAMMLSPDLSKWYFNQMLGLGDKEHNRKVREERERKRPIISDFKGEIPLWNIWVYYMKDLMMKEQQKQQGMPMPVQPGSLFSEKFMRRGVKTESEED